MAKEYDPRMHSAEHILNQTMVRMFNTGRSFRAHIEKKKSKCDYRFNRDLTVDEIKSIENKVNEIISGNLPVREEFCTLEEAKKFVDTSKLPENVGNKIRIIKIGDYDACPCIGQHVATTAEIGKFRIVSTGYNDGVLRIRFKLESI